MRKLPLDRKRGAARKQHDGQITRAANQSDEIMRKFVGGDCRKRQKIAFYLSEQGIQKERDEKERVNFDLQKRTGRLARTLSKKSERKTV